MHQKDFVQESKFVFMKLVSPNTLHSGAETVSKHVKKKAKKSCERLRCNMQIQIQTNVFRDLNGMDLNKAQNKDCTLQLTDKKAIESVFTFLESKSNHPWFVTTNSMPLNFIKQ